jgi:hypothetical protein
MALRNRHERLIEQGQLIAAWCFECLIPSRQRFSRYRRVFHAAPLNSLEEDVRGCREIVEFDGSAEGAGSEPQHIPLGCSPRAPFDDHDQAAPEELLAEIPLQRSIFPRRSSS